MKKVVFLVVLAILSLSLLASLSASAAVTLSKHRDVYNVISLTPGFTPWALNNNGVIAGTMNVYLGAGEWRHEAALWKDGQVLRLGVFGGKESFGKDLNDNGWMLIEVTYDSDTTPSKHLLALVNFEGIVVVTTELPSGNIYRRLNNLNQIVGWWNQNSYPWATKGLIWSHDYTVQVSATSGNKCTFENINNLGQAIGYASFVDHSAPVPIRWSNSAIWPLETAVGTATLADINDHGMIVGSYDTDSTHTTPYAFRPGLWDSQGRLLKLKSGDLPGSALWINNSGAMLGFVNNKPVIWLSAEHGPIYFSRLVTSIKVTNIQGGFNDAGQLTCYGQRADGTFGYYLLNPRYRR